MEPIKKDGRGSGSKANVGRKKRPDTKVVAVRLPAGLIQAHGIDSAWIKEAIELKLKEANPED